MGRLVSPVLVTIEPHLQNIVVRESEELKVFYLSGNERMNRDVYAGLINHLQSKMLE